MCAIFVDRDIRRSKYIYIHIQLQKFPNTIYKLNKRENNRGRERTRYFFIWMCNLRFIIYINYFTSIFNCTHCGYNEASYRLNFYFSRANWQNTNYVTYILLRITYVKYLAITAIPPYGTYMIKLLVIASAIAVTQLYWPQITMTYFKQYDYLVIMLYSSLFCSIHGKVLQ